MNEEKENGKRQKNLVENARGPITLHLPPVTMDVSGLSPIYIPEGVNLRGK